MASAFNKSANRKLLTAKAEKLKMNPEDKKYKKFYMDEKFEDNASYKKLFAPKSLITHRSSLI